jgi:hypothetical protein
MSGALKVGGNQCCGSGIRIRIHRIHLFLGLQDPDPDPLVRGMDPDPDPTLDPDPSIIMQKYKKNLDSFFLLLFLTFYL